MENKELSVENINGSYLDGLSRGIAACNAEFRVRMQWIYNELNDLPRINKSDMKRALYNHTSCELGEDINPNMREDNGELIKIADITYNFEERTETIKKINL